jgi:putative DNA primase/helicase
MTSANAAAADYRRGGWCPIPIKRSSKHPALDELDPYLSRPATTEELRSWSWPAVGLVTGPVSGVMVLDVDGPEGEAELKKYGHPATPMSRTPSGGMHLYFKHPEHHVRTRIKVAPGLDVKASGSMLWRLRLWARTAGHTSGSSRRRRRSSPTRPSGLCSS